MQASEVRKRVFSAYEKKTLLGIAQRYRDIVENKRTDGTSAKIKNDAWERITFEYNRSLNVNFKVTSKQLRRLWMNMKQRQRVSLFKVHQQTTDAGETDTKQEVIIPDMSQSRILSDLEVDDTSVNETQGQFTSTQDELEIETGNFACVTYSLTPTPPPASRTSQINEPKNPMQLETNDKQQRAKEIHEMEKELLREKIREARAKADLAELILQQQSYVPMLGRR